MSYAEQVFGAEEIARQIKNGMVPQPNGDFVKTEEIRPKSPQIINHNLTNANQWYELKIPINVVTWQIRCREDYDILYSYSPTHTTFFTLKGGEVLSADTAPKDIEQSEFGSVFVMCETAGAIIELEFWQR